MAMFRVLAELAEGLAGEAEPAEEAGGDCWGDCGGGGGVGGEDAGLFAMYLAGEPFAEADGRKLNAGGALLTKALLAVSGAGEGELTVAYRKYGDLGAAGFDLVAGQGQRWLGGGGLTFGEVAEAFAGMAGARTYGGAGGRWWRVCCGGRRRWR